MTSRTMTLKVTMNPDETLAIDSANQGMPMNKIGEGMIFALEGLILGTIAHRIGTGDPTDEMRETFALPIRAQTQQILNDTPTVAESGRRGITMTIPAKPFGHEGEDDVDS